MEFLVKVVALPFKLLRGAMKHPKAAVAVVIGIVALVAANNAFGHKPNAQQQAMAQQIDVSYQNNPPKTAYVIATSSRLYYVQTYTDVGGVVSSPNYWDYSLKKWEYHKTPLTIDRKTFGEVIVYANN